MSANLPKTLRFRGGTLNHAGQGRVPGSQVYFDVAKGQALELYMALVAQVGPAYGLVEVVGNRAITSALRLGTSRPSPGMDRAAAAGAAGSHGSTTTRTAGPAPPPSGPPARRWRSIFSRTISKPSHGGHCTTRRKLIMPRSRRSPGCSSHR